MNARKRLVTTLMLSTGVGSSLICNTLYAQEQSNTYQYFGIEYGRSWLSSQEKYEVKKQGYLAIGKTTTSMKFDPVVLDLGLGFFSSTLKSKDEENKSQKVEVKAGLLETGFRFIAWKDWQIGLLLGGLFGAETDFGPIEKANKSNALLGGQLFWAPESSQFWRIHLTYRSDVTIKTRDYRSFTIGLDFGIPWSRTQNSQNTPSKIEEKPQDTEPTVSTPEPEPQPQPEIIEPQPEPEIIEPEPQALIMDKSAIVFTTASANLTSKAQNYIKKIAAILIEHNDSWEKLAIEGHSDTKGNQERNKKLSQKRADAVVQELVKYGVDANKLTGLGFGSERPLDQSQSKEADIKNRRVEMNFSGQTDLQILSEKINQLNQHK